MHPIQTINLIVGGLLILSFIASSIISFFENEQRASLIFMVLCVPVMVIYVLPGLKTTPLLEYYAWFVFVITMLFFLLIAIPIKGNNQSTPETPVIRHDERDTMFSRRELIPGTEKFDHYYRHNPQNKEYDDKFRSKPGLLSPKAPAYDAILFAAAEASFFTVAAYRDFIDGKVNQQKTEVDPVSVSKFITTWGKKLGAKTVGFTELKKYHLYSVKGRREKYGKPIINNHQYAIALTVEMDKNHIDTAPDAPTVYESAQQYLNSGTIAVQIAQFIRELGYDAKAHIDGNYELICPLVARDAGLGEIGRMGLLMTPKLGPRVRIAVVTTNLQVMANEHKPDHSMIHFCEICKKCATNCPAKAIPFENRQKMDGIRRWKINSESCYTFWNTLGTDCGKCIRVCPYAHPDNLLHNMVRRGIQNNFIFSHLALKLDDFFYGKKPKKRNKPHWMNIT